MAAAPATEPMPSRMPPSADGSSSSAPKGIDTVPSSKQQHVVDFAINAADAIEFLAVSRSLLKVFFEEADRLHRTATAGRHNSIAASCGGAAVTAHHVAFDLQCDSNRSDTHTTTTTTTTTTTQKGIAGGDTPISLSNNNTSLKDHNPQRILSGIELKRDRSSNLNVLNNNASVFVSSSLGLGDASAHQTSSSSSSSLAGSGGCETYALIRNLRNDMEVLWKQSKFLEVLENAIVATAGAHHVALPPEFQHSFSFSSRQDLFGSTTGQQLNNKTSNDRALAGSVVAPFSIVGADDPAVSAHVCVSREIRGLEDDDEEQSNSQRSSLNRSVTTHTSTRTQLGGLPQGEASVVSQLLIPLGDTPSTASAGGLGNVSFSPLRMPFQNPSSVSLVSGQRSVTPQQLLQLGGGSSQPRWMGSQLSIGVVSSTGGQQQSPRGAPPSSASLQQGSNNNSFDDGKALHGQPSTLVSNWRSMFLAASLNHSSASQIQQQQQQSISSGSGNGPAMYSLGRSASGEVSESARSQRGGSQSNGNLMLGSSGSGRSPLAPQRSNSMRSESARTPAAQLSRSGSSGTVATAPEPRSMSAAPPQGRPPLAASISGLQNQSCLMPVDSGAFGASAVETTTGVGSMSFSSTNPERQRLQELSLVGSMSLFGATDVLRNNNGNQNKELTSPAPRNGNNPNTMLLSVTSTTATGSSAISEGSMTLPPGSLNEDGGFKASTRVAASKAKAKPLATDKPDSLIPHPPPDDSAHGNFSKRSRNEGQAPVETHVYPPVPDLGSPSSDDDSASKYMQMQPFVPLRNQDELEVTPKDFVLGNSSLQMSDAASPMAMVHGGGSSSTTPNEPGLSPYPLSIPMNPTAVGQRMGVTFAPGYVAQPVGGVAASHMTMVPKSQQAVVVPSGSSGSSSSPSVSPTILVSNNSFGQQKQLMQDLLFGRSKDESSTTSTNSAGGGGLFPIYGQPHPTASTHKRSQLFLGGSGMVAGTQFSEMGFDPTIFDSIVMTDHVIRSTDDVGTKMLNDYVLLQNLGQGSFGKVKLAFQPSKNRLVAIKVIRRIPSASTTASLGRVRDERLKLIAHEIDVMKKLRHKNIVSLYEVIDDPEAEKLYLVMQYVDNGAVSSGSMNPDGSITYPPLPLPEWVACGKQLCSGLAYLHEQGIAHRDIKPENILKSSNNQIFLADFGVAAVLRTPEEDENEHQASFSFRGTPLFMAPELHLARMRRMAEEEELDLKAVDMWALGITLYCLFTGHTPFHSGDEVANATDASVSGIIERTISQKHVAQVLRSMLRVHPGDRPAPAVVRGALKSIQSKNA